MVTTIHNGNHLAEDKTRYMVNPVAPVILRPVMMQRLGLLFGAENRWVFGDVYIYIQSCQCQ